LLLKTPLGRAMYNCETVLEAAKEIRLEVTAEKIKATCISVKVRGDVIRNEIIH
jgi:hypothetical protein